MASVMKLLIRLDSSLAVNKLTMTTWLVYVYNAAVNTVFISSQTSSTNTQCYYDT